MRIHRRAAYQRMRWKNGKGLTEQVAVYPEGGALDSFGWRLSMAHIEADGPFSSFRGIDRSITVLEGDGLLLTQANGSTQHLSVGGAPFSFPGEAEISGRNVGSPTIDLNVMTRRGLFSHVMQNIALAPTETFMATGDCWAVFSSPATLGAGKEEFSIAGFDSIFIEEGEEILNLGDEPACFVLVIIAPASERATEQAIS